MRRICVCLVAVAARVRLESLTYSCWIALCFVALAVAAPGRLADAQNLAPGKPKVEYCTAAPAEQADMPPPEAGVIKEILVTEGETVTKGQLLLQLDDSKVQQDLKVAEGKYNAAKAKADDDINIRYAIAAAAVALAEYDTNKKANDKVPGAVPHVKMNELFLKCQETKLAIEKATLDQKVARAEADAAMAEIKSAEVMVQRHKVFSPIAGEVVDIRTHKGESVQPMQQQGLIHVEKLDTMWVEGDVPPTAKLARADFRGKKADVITETGIRLPDSIVFVDPKTQLGGKFKVRAQVENVKLPNGDWLLHPSDQKLTIVVK